MNTILLIFFAIPIAVIIISIALQKIFKSPFIVAAIIFAIFIIIPFALDNLTLLVATIAYTIIAFITAVITKIICKIIKQLNNNETQLLSINGTINNDNGNLLTISSNGYNGIENELLTINTNSSRNNNSCSCGCNTSNDTIAVSANVFPNNSTNGRTGSFRGCFRRR